mmetsp:Transcript_40219/g.87924  ORF Transcript_40219/g.87924 Transcript_40219/m.87924 type:complete len:236 (+) Transcript_40219:688-1395(+)
MRPPATQMFQMPPPESRFVIAHLLVKRAAATSPSSPASSAEALQSCPETPVPEIGRLSSKKRYPTDAFEVRIGRCQRASGRRQTASETSSRGQSSRAATSNRRVCRPEVSARVNAPSLAFWRGPTRVSSAPRAVISKAGTNVGSVRLLRQRLDAKRNVPENASPLRVSKPPARMCRGPRASRSTNSALRPMAGSRKRASSRPASADKHAPDCCLKVTRMPALSFPGLTSMTVPSP